MNWWRCPNCGALHIVGIDPILRVDGKEYCGKCLTVETDIPKWYWTSHKTDKAVPERTVDNLSHEELQRLAEEAVEE